ncbi:tryptophan-rich sensory protein [Georgenia faecalis]|uniref:tryptophan-rich sensory protein n=1 Tax=Georgenia faecalis TaxID=2483799 RepID=UPI000FDC9399|nr:tryptophan-rich sensory protein [Georgenia faecalis]
MATRTPSPAARSAAPATRADVVRQVGVLVSAVLAIGGAFLGSGAFVGTPIADAAGGVLSADATPLAPASPAFSIWSVIYTGLAAYAVWQVLPGQRTDPRQRATGWWIALSMILNAAWVLAVQGDLLGLTVVVIVALLAVLCLIVVRLTRSRPRNLVDAVVVDGTIGLYLGWVSVATAANTAAVLASAGVDLPSDPTGVAVIAAVAVVGAALAWWSRGRLAIAAAQVWGLSWIAVGRLTGEPPSTPVGIAAIAAAAVIAVVAVVARLRRRDARR